MSEAIYDEKIAPVLAQLGQLCKDHDMPFLAIVEYAPQDFGQTTVQTPDQSMPMTMANIAARCRGNLDSFIISLLRYCRERGIDTAASFVANQFGRSTAGVALPDGAKTDGAKNG